MPLETYTGKSIPALMVRAQRSMGEDVRVIEVNRVRCWDGSTSFELVAADAEGCEQVDRSFVTSANSSELTSPVPFTAVAQKTATDPRPRFVALVGPTGSGKTTTIAKLIANTRLLAGKKCGAVSLDRFRVGAASQLKALANLAKVPFGIIGKNGVAASLKKFEDCEIVFVDTPGRGPRTQRESPQVDLWMAEIAPDEVHLALPAGLNSKLVARLINQYRERGITHLLPTKLDEMPGDWEAFDIAARLHMPMRWVTDGQEIPTDIRPARARLQAAMAGRKIGPDFG